MVTLPGLQPPGVVVQGGLGMASGLDSFDHVVPIMLGWLFWVRGQPLGC